MNKELRLALAKGHPEFAHIKDIDVHVASLPDPSSFDDTADDIQRLIFAPDPVTGVPRSDLALTLSRDTRPEVSEYIQKVLQQPLPVSVGAADVDTALDMVKHRSESLEDYANRLRELCNPNQD